MNQVGKPVYGNQLIGRDKELRLIKELIQAGQSIVIIAPRRMGKTSLLITSLISILTWIIHAFSLMQM